MWRGGLFARARIAEGQDILRTKLTDQAIQKTRPPERGERKLMDDEIPGFGVRILAPSEQHPTGARTFFFRYRVAGRQRSQRIGAFPTWTVKAAREEARALRKAVDRGDDPARERQEAREAPTVRDLAERYRVEALPGKAARSQVNDRRMVETRILPALGERKVADVHGGDVRALHRAISASGTPIRANRVLALLSAMFSLALQPKAGESAPWRDAAKGNPVRGVERDGEEGRERFFSPAELAAIGDALAQSQIPEADCLRLLMLTGARPGEAMAATWAEFAEPGYWDKPASSTKQRRCHRVPLAAAAVEFVERLRAARAPGALYVFPRSKSRPIADLRAAWRTATEAASLALRAQAPDPALTAVLEDLGPGATVKAVRLEAARRGLTLRTAPAGSRPYDLRHSFASAGAAGGISLQIVGALLGHSSVKTTMRYAHLSDDPLKAAAVSIGATIAGAGSPDNVEGFARRRA